MPEPIAIVGTACRFPGSASSPSKLWDLIREPRDVLQEFPPSRLNFSNFYNSNGETHGCSDVRNKSYLLEEDVRLFDAAFFRINPKEAAGLDPQQRILLETAYEAFEAAGRTIDKLNGSKTSVHVGVMTDDYFTIQARDPDTVGSHAATGLSRSILANRLSYFFNLKGPSMSVDTACSGSLVALHLAVQGLRNGEATQALVAGTSLLLDPHWFITESSLHMLSPDSRCRMWDAAANGYARGEGCAAILLKTLSQAIEDGDHIECIIRETGVNSDGNTDGLTMPSPTAQARLIRETYQKAGLDPTKDRCQYFECHGTGTPAGDPVEAQAIRDAFMPLQSANEPSNHEVPLYCGSIKTIIGHLEGCAGLAGVLKASLAIQHKFIPPNMHFQTLNPSISPFYSGLCVPTSLIPWPTMLDQPRRASVNSFGFGGTNAHAILESYEPTIGALLSRKKQDLGEGSSRAVGASARWSGFPGPFVFSGRNQTSLLGNMTGIADHIRSNPSLDLDALSTLLHSNRSVFPYKIMVPAAPDRQQLLETLEAQISRLVSSDGDSASGAIMSRQNSLGGILGIFTGQGAQVSRMGGQLAEFCPLFRDSIRKCEAALQSLPEAPSWSLYEELIADETQSRVSEALISQPICCAVQIGLIDLLEASGVHFGAVVGHSSGEIAAAYASGCLQREDAMAIAYYRGHVAWLAQGANGEEGGMLAAVMTPQEALDLCSQSPFAGRVCLAASNSPSSVTLSGDIDAIEELIALFGTRGIKARKLGVDKAYHSHHMERCSAKYLDLLKQRKVQSRDLPSDRPCSWFSSVYTDTDIARNPKEYGLDGQYWVDNLVNPVRFSQALESAIGSSNAPFAFAIEVGPHPALMGPVRQTLETLLEHPLPYFGCLKRAECGIETMSAALGAIWAHAGPAHVDFGGWRQSFGLERQRDLLKNVPTYAWDHRQVFWRESRLSHNLRISDSNSNSLLGRLHEDTPNGKTWRNIFHLDELPWLRGHNFQGQVLFPGAGYMSLAIEAGKRCIEHRPLRLVEIRDMTIAKALVINEDSGVEIIFKMRAKQSFASSANDDVLEVHFESFASSDGRILEQTCTGRAILHLGERTLEDAPPSTISRAELVPLSTERFYRATAETGLEYNGIFRAIDSISRTWGHAKATASWPKGDLAHGCTPHPALLDTAFQAGFGTFLSTAENTMGSSFLPVAIKRAIIDPHQSYQDGTDVTRIEVEALLIGSPADAVEVNIEVATNSGFGLQVEGLVLKAIADPSPSQDRNIFAKTVWDLESAYGLTAPTAEPCDSAELLARINAYERVTLFYMRSLIESVRPEELTTLTWYHAELFRYINTVLDTVRHSKTTIWSKEWLEDDIVSIRALSEAYRDDVDMAMLTTVGENMSSVVRGESQMIEHMLEHGLLSRLYTESKSLTVCNKGVAEMARQISHKHPQVRILEIGAGTGGTTLGVLSALGDNYSSYTVTDLSASFFAGLQDRMHSKHASKVDYKVFDVEKSPTSQGFVEGDYDIIIAANVLHATSILSGTMENVRALLRPAGHLIAIEVTGNMLRETAIMGALEGWWLGTAEGRKMGPGISIVNWDDLLRKTGFTGVDCVVYDNPDTDRHSCSAFATQATGGDYDLLRDPLSSPASIPAMPLLIIGGKTLPVRSMIQRAEKLLRHWAPTPQIYASIDEVNLDQIPAECFVLCLSDLDKPFFSEESTDLKIKSLQATLAASRCVLWVTSGRMMASPYANMMVGVGRALGIEMPETSFHFLDFDSGAVWDANLVAQQVLRFALSSLSATDPSTKLLRMEHEVLVRDGNLLIPRVVQDQAANESLNAKRRRLSKSVDPSENVELVIKEASESYLIRSLPGKATEDTSEVQVQWSIALDGHDKQPMHLCYGHLDTQDTVLAITNQTSSSILVASKDLFRLSGSTELQTRDLAMIGSHLVASLSLGGVSLSGTTLVLASEGPLARSVQLEANRRGIKIKLITISSTAAVRSPDWIHVHPFATSHTIRRLIPADTTTLLSLESSGLETVRPLLAKSCEVHEINVARLLRSPSFETASIIAEACKSWSRDESASTLPMQPVVVVDIENAPAVLAEHKQRLSAILDWRRTAPIQVLARAIDPRDCFSPDKTYFLVGMAGELGQSLCQFMTRVGARHIVLASRNPPEDPHWIKELRLSGACIRIVKMDVTKREQVREVVATLRKTMPKIAGVANAALVLEAGVFANFSAASIDRQLSPKVNGSIHLDDEFHRDDLDFFLTFGSLATVCGNPGQAMYHAGNLFMSSLVEQRRRRGQAGSILNFGLLVDVGYVARMDRDDDGSNIEGTLRKLLLTPLSEAEFHHVVLQGIISGVPTSPSGEVIMGIEPYVDDGEAVSRPSWVDQPFFSHMIKHSAAGTNAVQNSSSTSQQKLRNKLEQASDLQQATAAVEDLFHEKLELMIQVTRSSIDTNAPLSDLGLDSLNGIEIRQWLRRELLVDVPLLKILGREPFSALCAYVAQKFLETRDSSPLVERLEGTAEDETPPQAMAGAESNVVGGAGDTDSTQPETDPALDTNPEQLTESQSSLFGRRKQDSSRSSTTLNSFTDDNSRRPSLWSSEENSRRPSVDTEASSVVSASPGPLLLPGQVLSPSVKFSRTARMSFAQAGIHFLHALRKDPSTFNVTTQYTIRGSLDVKRLSGAIEKTLTHHEAYRTCFFADSGSSEVRQHVASGLDLRRLVEIHSTADNWREITQSAFNTVAAREYSLSTGETFRALVVTHQPQWHTVIFGFHLIASDALSFSYFLQDLNRAYQYLPLNPIPKTYLDHTQQQYRDLESGNLDEHIEYWRTVLDPMPAPLPLLPLAHVKTRQAQSLYINHIVEKKLSSATVQTVRKFAQSYGSTLMQFHLAVMQVLIARLTESDDFCIGVTDSGRSSGRFATTIGHFANVLPMRFRTKHNESFRTLLEDIRNTVLEAFDNAQVPFDVLLERIGVERSAWYTPIFQAAFNYRVGDVLEVPLGNSKMVMDNYLDIKTPYDLTINVTQTSDKGLSIECITTGNLYTYDASELLLNTYVDLIENLTMNPSVNVQDCKLFGEAQIERAMKLGRGPLVRYKWPATLSARLQQVTSEFGDCIALQDPDTSLTYKQLSDEIAICVAGLQAAKVEKGSRIACLCEPSVGLYILMLSILHIGAIYVPLDVALPRVRHRQMIDACSPSLLVCHTATIQAAKECCEGRDIDSVNISKLSRTAPAPTLQPSVHDSEVDAFILFTSGSTGTPKGIRLSQVGIMNYAASKQAHLNLRQPKVLQQTSCGFDMAIAQAYNAFANGGTLVVAPLKARGDPSILSQIIHDERIELTICTPSEYQLLATYAGDLLRRCTSWMHACSGGEVVTPRLLDALQRLDLPNLTLTDCYGPTEVSCATTFKSVLVSSSSEGYAAPTNTVGKAIPNTAIYILSEDGSTILPAGIPGEICISGRGVAKGYLDPTASEAKFVVDSFSGPHQSGHRSATLYKTGDRGFLQTDGSLVFLGRTGGGETVIKLRGLRIDLDEVAGAIMKAVPENTLVEAVVTARGEPKFLVAHVVFAPGKDLTQDQLHAAIQSLQLPVYMIPALAVPIKRLPTTPNGKIDRKTLETLPLPTALQKHDAHSMMSVPEGELRNLWLEVLGDAAAGAVINPESDFFMIGGSSLLLVRLQNSLKERIGVRLSLRDLYQSTTLKAMAGLMHTQRGTLSEDSIDWNMETSFPDDMLEATDIGIPNAPPRKQQRHVLLTGSTSFLGGEILLQLIDDPDVDKIHCVAVPEHERSRILSADNEKVVIYSGSLLSPTLGLSSTEMLFLQYEVDEIIHAAVQGHCMNNYTSVKQALYLSTQNLARMALPRKIPFHLISAPRVVLLSGKTEGGPVSMSAHPPPVDGSQGVTAAKWASERFLEKLARDTDLPVVIHRHCALVGERAPADDVMNSVVRFSLLSGKVPKIEGALGFFDFENVETVAREIISRESPQSGIVAYRHHSSNVRVPFDEFGRGMSEVYGRKFEEVSPEEWLKASAECGMQELLVIHLKANMESTKPLIFPYLGA